MRAKHGEKTIDAYCTQLEYPYVKYKEMVWPKSISIKQK